MRFPTHSVIGLALLLAMITGHFSQTFADKFTIRESGNKTVTLNARLAGAERGVIALETADGQFRLVPQGAVTRVPGDDPKPITHEQMAELLQKQFGEKLFRSSIRKPFVIGLVLSSPLKKREETRCKVFLQKAGRIMRNMERAFIGFSRRMKLTHHDPRFPLVLIIFENDNDFETYAKTIIKGNALSVSRVSGFYNKLTNWLAIRLSECHDYKVPLHEAIHQQVYNRGVMQRLSPAPTWFHEGIATGFAGNGDKISVLPSKVSKQYAKRSLSANRIDWSTIVGDDRPFRGNILAGDAYTHAWGLHWLLVTKHTKNYVSYVRKLAARKTLETMTKDERIKEFRDTFGQSATELQSTLPRNLAQAIKKQKIALIDRIPAGVSHTRKNLADITVTAESKNGILRVGGRMNNISPIRSMTFYITVETNAGTYADWLIPNLKSGKNVKLQPLLVRKLMKNGRGGMSSSFRVRVRAAAPESPEAQRWIKGAVPIPVFGG